MSRRRTGPAHQHRREGSAMKIRNWKSILSIMSAGILSALLLAVPAASAHPAPPTPEIVQDWAAASNTSDPQAMANLFTPDGTYTDLALNFVSTGHTAIAAWEQNTDLLIADVHITITEAFRSNNHIAAETVYSG